MEIEEIISEISNLMSSHDFYDRGDYLDGVLDGLQMALDIIEKHA